MIRVLLVDDEPLARQGLQALLAEEPDLDVIGEAVDGVEAVEMIRALEPDLVLLDVQMPEIDGFEVVRQVAEHHLPVVVFVSAYDRYALRAFEVHALDYVLKPPSRERLREALNRARLEILREERGTAAALAGLVDQVGPPALEAPRRIVVKERDRFLLVREDEIEWIEAAGNYAGLHARGKLFLIRATLADLERRLGPRFVRIHRSTIVDSERVREVIPDRNGDFDVRLASGAEVKLSRTYRDRLLPRG